MKTSSSAAQRPPVDGREPRSAAAVPRTARTTQTRPHDGEDAYPATASALAPSAAHEIAVGDGVGAAQSAAAGAVDAGELQQRADGVVAGLVGVDGADVREGGGDGGQDAERERRAAAADRGGGAAGGTGRSRPCAADGMAQLRAAVRTATDADRHPVATGGAPGRAAPRAMASGAGVSA